MISLAMDWAASDVVDEKHKNSLFVLHGVRDGIASQRRDLSQFGGEIVRHERTGTQLEKGESCVRGAQVTHTRAR
jgi:hypothetical protein